MNQTQNEKFCDLLAVFDSAVLITPGSGNVLHAQPMAIARVDADCDLWFITNLETARGCEIDLDTRAQVICQNGRSSCLSISGRASIVYDRAKIQDLWNASLQVWFSRGMNDPEIVAIHFVMQQGEYWDSTGVNRISYLYEAIKAIVTGTPLDVQPGEQHGHVTLEKQV